MFSERKCSIDGITNYDYTNFKVMKWYYLIIIIAQFYINYNYIFLMTKNDRKNTTELLRQPNNTQKHK